MADAKTGVVTSEIQDALGNPASWNPLSGPIGSKGLAVDKDKIVRASQVTPPSLAKSVLKAAS